MVNKKQFLLRISEELREAVQRESEEEGCNQSQWIRMAIQEKLDRKNMYTGENAEPNVPEAARRKKDAWWL